MAAQETLATGIRSALESLAAGRFSPDLLPDLPLDAVAHHGLAHELRSRIGAGHARSETLDAICEREERKQAALDLECERIGAAVRRRSLAAPILLKGASIARRYPDPAHRPYNDVDLLVPEREWRAWIALLRDDLGYRAPRLARSFPRHHHDAPFRREAGGLTLKVDLHAAILMDRSTRHVGFDALAPEAEASAFPHVAWLRPHAHLVVAALHLLHHRRDTRRLLWYRDFLFLRGDVTAASALARRLRVEWAVDVALQEVERALGVAMPATGTGAATAPLPRIVVETQRERFSHLGYRVAQALSLGPLNTARYVAARLANPKRRR